ncbi:hypothetical protein BCR35DRAFT_350183 [Leucosporidium creatinivorum]|uniref:Uncharacterized protein n=1 Tax=Leucosporidium creatinivorum TaxID=106004 RepID=A0A1Y2FZV1_9BASI|nr:hypothetical protein BCR35DRAFT_350183 [Leucosporidium creatinivorum]
MGCSLIAIARGLSTLLASLCLSVLGTYILPNITSLKTMAESLDIGSANWPTWAILVAGIFTALHIALSLLQICCDGGLVGWVILITAIIDCASYGVTVFYKQAATLCAGVATSITALDCSNTWSGRGFIALFVVSGLCQLVSGGHGAMGSTSASIGKSSAHPRGRQPRGMAAWRSRQTQEDEEEKMEHQRMLQRKEDRREEMMSDSDDGFDGRGGWK